MPFPCPLPPASTTVRGLPECPVCSAQPGTTLESPSHAQGAHGPLTPPVPGIKSKHFMAPTLFPFGATPPPPPPPLALSLVSFLSRSSYGREGGSGDLQTVHGLDSKTGATACLRKGPPPPKSLSLPLHRWAQARQRELAGPEGHGESASPAPCQLPAQPQKQSKLEPTRRPGSSG